MKKIITLSILTCTLITTTVGCSSKGNNNIQAYQEKNSANECSSKYSKEIETYIEKNHSSVQLNAENYIKGFSILDDSINKHDVFLAGESHGTVKSYDMQLALLKYFNQKHGIRYLLTEEGYSSSVYMNKYLETGNPEILNFVYDELKGTATWSKESYEFWKKLRDYNMTIPDAKKIRVIGIDIEHQLGTAYEYLYSLIPNRSTPIKIKPTIEKLKISKGNIENKDDLKKTIQLLQNDIKENQNVYKKYLGNNFFDFNIVADNIINSINAYDLNFDDIREKSIYNNFKRVYSHFPKEKYFGQWGMEHVYQRACESYMGKKDRFAMYLNKNDSPVKNRVLSIAYEYKDCFRMDRDNNYEETKMGTDFKDIDIIDKYSKSDITIFKFDGNKSPFTKKVYFINEPFGGVTTDYFQYIVLIKNSRGAIPLQKF